MLPAPTAPRPDRIRKACNSAEKIPKWHLNGLRGPGVPILAGDDHNPGHFGFDEWLSVSNFFDRNPVLSRQGTFEEFEGDSSDIVVDEALRFIEKQVRAERPFLSVISMTLRDFQGAPD